MKKRIAGFGLLVGTMVAGCGGRVADQDTDQSAGPPPLSDEDQAVVAHAEANTLSEIELPEGHVTFVEVSPGDVLVEQSVPIGTDLPAVDGTHELTLEQLHLAYAPDAEVPEEIYDAMERARKLDQESEDSKPTVDLEAGGSMGTPPLETPQSEPSSLVTQALTSSISSGWFEDQYCGVYADDYEWCFTHAWQGAWARRKTHRGKAALCGDKGGARMRINESGNTIYVSDVAYGWCNTFYYHGPHGIAGGPRRRTVSFTVDWAHDRVRFSGFFVDNHAFVAVPPGFD